MDKKAKRTYDKAMNYYEQGKIDKALELCEEALSEGLDNPVVLNFKGLLLYQKGNLNDAVTVWKINKDLNNDDIAKNYIEDSAVDEERVELYKQGEQALKQFKIDKALDLFKICAKSDFNSIKVNTGIAMCYQKKGEFIKAKEYVNKVLRVDKNAATAKIIERELRDSGIDSEKSSRTIIIVAIVIVIIAAIAASGYVVISKYKNKSLYESVQKENNFVSDENNEKNETEDRQVNNNDKEKPEDASSDTSNESGNATFDKEKVKALIVSNDFDGIYDQLKNIKKDSINSSDIEVYNKAVDLMKDKGISKFYEYGLWYFNQGNYSAAKTSFDKAYAYCEGSSIKEHILFYRASNSAKEADNKGALEQFEEYYKQYPKGVYAQEALYELALLSNSVDKEKSKTYASTLMKNFPDSIYVNDNIKNILKG